MKRVYILCFFLAASLTLLAATASAGQALLSWDAPTAYEDGDTLSAEDITGYTIKYGPTSGGPYPYSVDAAGTAKSITVRNIAAGTWYFVATVTATNGLTSEPSLQVSKTVLPSKPGRPRLR